ncbi:MAG: hypothetical protein CMP23_08110 [Rickettsiales bacterium]|nr:hypothetical protein [Rickettsiales bacterium]
MGAGAWGRRLRTVSDRPAPTLSVETQVPLASEVLESVDQEQALAAVNLDPADEPLTHILAMVQPQIVMPTAWLPEPEPEPVPEPEPAKAGFGDSSWGAAEEDDLLEETLLGEVFTAQDENAPSPALVAALSVDGPLPEDSFADGTVESELLPEDTLEGPLQGSPGQQDRLEEDEQPTEMVPLWQLEQALDATPEALDEGEPTQEAAVPRPEPSVSEQLPEVAVPDLTASLEAESPVGLGLADEEEEPPSKEEHVASEETKPAAAGPPAVVGDALLDGPLPIRLELGAPLGAGAIRADVICLELGQIRLPQSQRMLQDEARDPGSPASESTSLSTSARAQWGSAPDIAPGIPRDWAMAEDAETSLLSGMGPYLDHSDAEETTVAGDVSIEQRLELALDEPDSATLLLEDEADHPEVVAEGGAIRVALALGTRAPEGRDKATRGVAVAAAEAIASSDGRGMAPGLAATDLVKLARLKDERGSRGVGIDVLATDESLPQVESQGPHDDGLEEP